MALSDDAYQNVILSQFSGEVEVFSDAGEHIVAVNGYAMPLRVFFVELLQVFAQDRWTSWKESSWTISAKAVAENRREYEKCQEWNEHGDPAAMVKGYINALRSSGDGRNKMVAMITKFERRYREVYLERG